MENEQVERRRHKRVKVTSSILASTEFTPQDLSESGMQLSCTSELRKGRTIELKLTLDGESFTVHAEVVWCRKASSIYESGYHVGVQFVGHSISQQLVIRNYVEKYSYY